LLALLLAAILTLGLLAPLRAADIPVTTTDDNLTANRDCSLREAIQAANERAPVDACPAGDGHDRILLPAGVYPLQLAGADEDDNRSGDLDIKGDLRIDGPGREEAVISGEGLDRVLHVQITATVVISGVSIIDGHAPDGMDATEDNGENGAPGGGILNEGRLALEACALHDNQAGHGGDISGTAPDGTFIHGGHGGGGGAIFNQGVLRISHCRIYDNRAGGGGSYGGGSDYDGSGGNGGNGGGIFSRGALTMTMATVQGNQAGGAGTTTALFASDGYGGAGGGLNSQGSVWVQAALITGNRARTGGGMDNSGVATILSSTIAHNVTWAEGGRWSPPGGRGDSSGSGGGLVNTGVLTITQSAIIANHTSDGGSFGGGSHTFGGRSGSGGGIVNGGALTITQSTVSGNWTGDGGYATWGGDAGDGGGIASNGALTLENVTIADNAVGQAGGGDWGDGRDGLGGGLRSENEQGMHMRNTIVASNHITATASDCFGTIVSHDYNLVQAMTGCTLTGDTAHNLIGVDPQLTPAGDHGGPTPTNGVGFFSPVVDAGSCTDMNGAPVTPDQRGVPRPVGGGCDIGAVEVLPPTDFVYLPLIAGR
jgi:CSLREA domain-containing protein